MLESVGAPEKHSSNHARARPVGVTALLCGVLALSLAGVALSPVSGFGTLFLGATIAGCAFEARPRDWGHSRPGLFMVAIFGAIWWILAPVAQVASGALPFRFTISQATYDAGSWMFGVFLTGLVASYVWLARRSLPGARLAMSVPSNGVSNSVRLFHFIVSSSCVLAIAASGTLVAYRADVVASIYSDGVNATDTVLRNILVVTPGVIGLMAAARLANRRTGDEMTRFHRSDLFLVALGLIATNPIANARFLSGAFLIAALLIYSRRRQRTAWFWSTIVFASLLVIFPVADAYRNGPLQSESWEFNFSSLDYDNFVLTAKSTTIEPENIPPNQVISAAAVFVPRALWEGKSPSTGVVIRDGLGLPGHFNLAGSGIAAARFDYGLPGVAVLGVAFGLLVSAIDRRLQVQGLLPEAEVFLVLCVGLLPYVTRGSLDNGYGAVYAGLFVCLGLFFFRTQRLSWFRSPPEVGIDPV